MVRTFKKQLQNKEREQLGESYKIFQLMKRRPSKDTQRKHENLKTKQNTILNIRWGYKLQMNLINK